GLTALDGTAVTVTDTPPAGLTLPNNAASGTNWTCTQTATTVTCTRSDALASNASYEPITLTVNVANNAPSTVTTAATVSGGGDLNPVNDTANDPTTTIPPPPDLSITKTHAANFNQGQSFVPYTLTVSNAAGATATSGTVTITDTLPTGLTFAFASGFNWSCLSNPPAVTCTRSDVLAGGNSYQPLTLFVNVDSNPPASLTNNAVVSGGGDVTPGNNTANDPTTINPSPDLTVTKTHTDPFTVGQPGIYTITVTNSGHAPTSGVVTVTDPLPFGLVVSSFTATGWTCSGVNSTFLSCNRSDALAASSSYPTIVLTVSVFGGGPAVTNVASVSGGGEFNGSNNTASDPTNILAPLLTITKSHTPATFTVGQSGTYTIT